MWVVVDVSGPGHWIIEYGLAVSSEEVVVVCGSIFDWASKLTAAWCGEGDYSPASAFGGRITSRLKTCVSSGANCSLTFSVDEVCEAIGHVWGITMLPGLSILSLATVDVVTFDG